MSPFVTFLAQATEQAVAQATPVVANMPKEGGISPIVFFLAGLFGLLFTIYCYYQFFSIARSTRETAENTEKAVVLLTVLANKQGASQDDIAKAMGK